MTTEIPIDIATAEEGIGSLIVTDAALLVQARKVPGQYPASVKHDTVHAYSILCLGNDMGIYTTHIVSRLAPKETHNLLDQVFYAYVDACCLQLWCDACVNYIVDGETVKTQEYGFEDGQYTMRFNVYCGVAEDKTEEFLAKLINNVAGMDFVVVRPDSSEFGCTIRSFTVAQNDDNGPDDYDDSNDDEDDGCPHCGSHSCNTWDCQQ